MGYSSPEALINTLWLNNTQYFGLRGCQAHRVMKWGDVQLKTTSNGLDYLEYNERQTKTRTGAEANDTRKVKPRMFAVAGSDRDPVMFYRIYVSKRPAELHSEESPYYLAINNTKNPNSTKPWFKAAPMGVNKLNSLMKTMAEKGQLNTSNLTNHSARKRMVQKLNDEGVPPTQIMQISGHKNVQSLNNYCTLSENQQRRISNILTDAHHSESTSTVAESSQHRITSTPNSNFALFGGATIQGGTFNITINTVNQSPTFREETTMKRRRRYCILDSPDSD